MHIEHELTIAAQEAESARAVAEQAWTALQSAHDGRPHLESLRADWRATISPAPNAMQRATYQAWERAVLVELFDLYSAHIVAADVARLAEDRLAALRALAAADTYECAAGAGVAQ